MNTYLFIPKRVMHIHKSRKRKSTFQVKKSLQTNPSSFRWEICLIYIGVVQKMLHHQKFLI